MATWRFIFIPCGSMVTLSARKSLECRRECLYSLQVEIKEYRYQGSKTIVSVIHRGHPWIHRDALSSAVDAIPPASLVRIVDGQNHFAAHAIYEPHGSIAMRILLSQDPFSVDQLQNRLLRLINKKMQKKGESEAFRLINGEGDVFPGLTCDVYGTMLVWQPYLQFWDALLPALAETAQIAMVLDRHIVRPPTHRRMAPYMLKGEEPAEPVVFSENGTKLCAWPLTGQKSGFFLDLKEVRLLLPDIVKGRSVLNCFANTGAFSLIARHRGAGRILSLESDAGCQKMAAAQMEANGHTLPADEWKTADVFDMLPHVVASGQKFDVVIIDPPNMCTKKSSLAPALKGWEKLLRLGTEVLGADGRIVAINCSSFMSKKLCDDAVKELKLKTERFGGLPADHTVRKNFPEGDYLKWWLYTK